MSIITYKYISSNVQNYSQLVKQFYSSSIWTNSNSSLALKNITMDFSLTLKKNTFVKYFNLDFINIIEIILNYSLFLIKLSF